MFLSSDETGVIYTTDDLVLFRESPFAAWMERLTLENPDHGIAPDRHSPYSGEHTEALDDIIATLREEGRDVAVVDSGDDQQRHIANTRLAMRGGADFIVNAYLSDGELAARVGLLMRTSGFSDYGDYLYIPCEARPIDKRHSSFRLCVFADLLHAVQGQLPPQMLIISDAADLSALQTEDHIHYYRAVKARFLQAMADFRKHKMPDPAESAFFGRWAGCAAQVLKQRAERDEAQEQEQSTGEAFGEQQIVEEIVVELPRVQVAGGNPEPTYTNDPLTAKAEVAGQAAEVAAPTLAEQASMLAPDSFHPGHAPGHTPNLARVAPLRPVDPPPAAQEVVGEGDTSPPEATVESVARGNADVALENLEFIGSGPASFMGREPLVEVPGPAAERAEHAASEPPAASLGMRETFEPESPWPVPEPARAERSSLPELEPPEPVLMPPEPTLVESAPEPTLAEPAPEPLHRAHPLDSVRPEAEPDSLIDMDGAPPPTLSPLGARADAQGEVAEVEQKMTPSVALRSFSDSLLTGEDRDKPDEP